MACQEAGLYQGGDLWKPDRAALPAITSAALRALGARGSEVIVMGVPRGSGTRMALDRDRDGYFDGDELDAGSDPGNPASTPGSVGVGGGLRDELRALGPNPFRESTTLRFALARSGRVDAAVYDVLGREVRTLARGAWFGTGEQTLAWDGRDGSGRAAGAGVYFLRVRTPSALWTRTVVRVK